MKFMKIMFFFSIALLNSNTLFSQWTPQNSGTNAELNAVFFTGKDTGFVVGSNGVILKTINGGSVWFGQNSGVIHSLNAVFFLNDTIGFIVGDYGVFLKTINGGANWTQYDVLTPQHLYSIQFVNESIGYAGSGNGVLHKSIDGGVNWTPINMGNNLVITSIQFTDENNGLVNCCDFNGVTQILKTNNGGASWTTSYSSSTIDFHSIFFIPQTNFQTGFAVGKANTGSARIIRTIDGGTTWQAQSAGLNGELRNVFFPDNNRGYAVGLSGKMIRTTDIGATWVPMISQTDKNLYSTFFTSQDTGYVVGSQGLILKTTNGGLTPVKVLYQSPSIAKRYGNSVSFHVTAIGTLPVSYQWKLNGNDLDGANDSVLSITNINFEKEGVYTCVISNPLNTIESDTIKLMILDIGEVVGDSVFLNISNTSGNIQWQESVDTLSWVDIPNAIMPNYSFVSSLPVGKKFYRAKIHNEACPLIPDWYSRAIRSLVVENISQIPAGVSFHGGICYYADGIGNGLIVSLNDQSNGVQWGCYNDEVFAYSGTDGLFNCSEILATCAQRPIAASICDTLNVLGYDDWFLPAAEQQSKLLNFKDVIGNLIGSYWSSSAGTTTWAWYYSFAHPDYGVNFGSIHDKNVSLKARAIRQFTSSETIHKTYFSIVSEQPQRVISNIINPDTTLCKGSSVVFMSESTGTGDYYTYNYQWKKDNQNVASGSTPNIQISNVSATDEGFYKIEVSNVCGTSTSDSILVKVIEVTADAGAPNAGGYYRTCPGGSFQLNGSVWTNHPELGNLSFIWSPDSTLNDASSLTPISTPYQHNNYTLTANHPFGCSASSTAYTWMIQPEVDAGYQISKICGDTAKIIDVSCNFDNMGDITYQWTPNLFISNDTIINPIVNPNTSMYYKVNITSTSGCSGSDSVLINIIPLQIPIGMYSIIAGNCVAFDGVTTNYNGPDSVIYSWATSPWLNDTTIRNPIANPCETSTFYVTASTPNGCLDTNSVHLYVTPLNINCSPQTYYCMDTLLIPITTNYTGSDTLSFLWQPSIGLSDSLSQNPLVYTDSAMVYSVQVRTSNGCIAINESIMINLTPMQSPEICIVSVDSSNKNIIVWEDVGNFPMDSINAEAIDFFNIYRETNITNIYEKIGEIPYDSLHVFKDLNSQPTAQSNRYKLTMTDKCGYETSYSNPHKTMHLSINQGAGTTWNLIWQAYEGFNVATYNIYRKTDSTQFFELIGTMSGVNTQYNDLTAPAGNVYYQVEVVKSGGSCDPSKSYASSKSNIASNNASSISSYDLNSKFDVSIYPNPGNDFVQIKHNAKENVNVEISDAIGRIVYSDVQNEKTKVYNFSFLNQGIYFISISTTYYKKIEKLIIKR